MMRIAIVLALAACGDNRPDPRPAHSGTRVKLRYFEYADGTRQRDLALYHDSAWNEPCRPVRWSDGARYCTPDAAEAFYTDPACTNLVGRASSAEPPPRYFTAFYSVQGVPYPSTLYRAGDRTDVPQQRWVLDDGLCKGPLVNDGAYDYYLLGEKLADPARIKRSESYGDGDLQLADDYSDDGLRAPIMFSDRKYGECATPERANADTVECVPLDSVPAAYFHDGQCTEPVLTVAGSTIPALVASFDIITGCQQMFPIATELMAPQLFTNLGGICNEVQPPNGVRFFSTAAAIDLPKVVRERESADRRLRRIDRVTGELRLEDTFVYDSELATDCVPSGDVCMPVTNIATQTFFSDDTCATPLEVALVAARACDPPVLYATKSGELVPLTGRISNPFYELSTGDTCRVYAPPIPYVAYGVGAPLGRERLVPFTIATEP